MEYGLPTHLVILFGGLFLLFGLLGLYNYIKYLMHTHGTKQLLYLLFWSQVVWRIFILSALLYGVTEYFEH